MPDRLDRDRLVAEAIDTAESDDFGDDTWQEGFDRLLGSLVHEGRLSDLGVEAAATDVGAYVVRRLELVAWRAEHSEIANGTIDRPIFIVGQPRTGTTILYDLLAQDPELRAPLSWEVDKPVPPPETATYDTDLRIAEVQAQLDLADLVIPGFTDFHPMGAKLAQECVRMTGSDFRSMIFSTQYHVPSYHRWLLDEADLAPAYRWHRGYLQHLQSRHPAPTWLLKSPAHLWHLDAVAAEYPDAVVVQTHRDPLKVIASLCALIAFLRRMACGDPTIPEAATDWTDDIFEGLDRGSSARDRCVLPPERFVDVQFADFMADQLATIERIYDQLGRELTGETADRMRAFLAAHPGDGGGSGSRYRFADTGLDESELRERACRYQERFDVPSEPVV